MPWIYHQATGKLFHDDKLVSAHGYAGHGMWKNNPGGEMLQDKGPLPRGTYRISNHFIHHPTAGKHVLRLTPSTGNQMFGRSGFLIHGDSITAPGTASDGCIVLPLAVRQEILISSDEKLEVKK